MLSTAVSLRCAAPRCRRSFRATVLRDLPAPLYCSVACAEREAARAGRARLPYTLRAPRTATD